MEYPHPAGPGSWLQVLQVLRQGVLLDVLLDVPAREMRLQVLLHHEVQGGLAAGQREEHPVWDLQPGLRVAQRPPPQLPPLSHLFSVLQEAGRCCPHPCTSVGETEAGSFATVPEATWHGSE